MVCQMSGAQSSNGTTEAETGKLTVGIVLLLIFFSLTNKNVNKDIKIELKIIDILFLFKTIIN